MTCNCGQPTRDNQYVCDDDLSTLSVALGDLPALVEQLDITLQGARGIDYTALGGSPGSESPLPISYAAYEASTQLRQVLVTWVRFCTEEDVRHQSPNRDLPADNLVAMSRWLMWRVDGLGFNDLGWDAVSEITRAVGKCRMVIDRPEERQFDGPCECGRDLYSKPGSKVTKCKGCEREYGVEDMRKWMETELGGKLFTAREGSTLLGRMGLPTAQKTIDSWHDRGRLIDHGSNADKPPRLLYLLDDLIALAAKHASKAA